MAPTKKTATTTTTALERKQAQFLAQFADAVFLQWTQSPEKERFWQNGAFLRDLLEEAVAKLPKIALKGHLVRELTAAVAALKQLLEQRYADFQTSGAAQQPSTARTLQLLSEADVEHALAAADAAKQHELAALLAIDDFAVTSDAPATIASIEALAKQLQLVSARRYETPSELAHKRGFLVQRIAESGAELVRAWAADARGNWSCSPAAANSVALERLRAVLQTILAADAVAASSAAFASVAEPVLAAPWSAFYRPRASAIVASADYDSALAQLCGLVLALAIYFPIIRESDSSGSDSDDTSEDSDTDAQATRRSGRAAARSAPLDWLAQAKQSVQCVAFAARSRSASSWLIAVLTALHALPKPASYKDDDGETLALDAADRRALSDCLADVYTRAFADLSALERYAAGHESPASDWQLFQTVCCVRRAAQFMRAERRQSVPAVTTAMVALASVPLPPSFWLWLAQVKRVYALQPPLVRDVMKKFSKSKASKMASALLSATDVTDAELAAVAEVCFIWYCSWWCAVCNRSGIVTLMARYGSKQHYDAFLKRGPDEPLVSVGADASADDASAPAAAPGGDELFFVDSAGGSKTATSKKTKRKNKSKADKRKAAAAATSAQQQAAKKAKQS